jgi:DNA-binding beta-propeller fold protein YncE
MKRLITNCTKHNKKQKLSKDSKLCKIIDTIENIKQPQGIIKTPYGKILIGVENNSIFRYNLKTKQKFRIAGSVDKFGHQDGTRDESRFYSPNGLILSKDLKTLFVSDTCNRVIRAICVQTGMTTTFAGQVGKWDRIDGPKEKACFKSPGTLKLSPDGNTLIVVDVNKLRTICIATGQVDTIYTLNIRDFTLSPDGKHIYILNWYHILKYNLETGKAEIVSVLEDKGYFSCEISKDRLLFISNMWSKEIKIVNLDTTQVIGSINTHFDPSKLEISTNGKQLYVGYLFDKKIQVFDISKYCTNYKTFLQLQLSKHSFLPRPLIKRLLI